MHQRPQRRDDAVCVEAEDLGRLLVEASRRGGAPILVDEVGVERRGEEVEQGGALRIDFEPFRLREVANTVVNVFVARGVRFGPLDAKGSTIEGRYDVMEEAAWLLISGVDDKAIGGGS